MVRISRHIGNKGFFLFSRAIGNILPGLILIFVSSSAVAAGECLQTTNGAVVIDYQTVEITPEFQLNGAPFPDGEPGSVEIWLAQDGLLQVKLGDTHLPVEPVHVVTGTYDLVYRDLTPFTPVGLPANTYATFQPGVVIDSDGPLVANVVTATLSGEVTHNGGGFPQTALQSAGIYAVGVSGLGEVHLYDTHLGPFAQVLIAGRYDIVYRHSDGNQMPQNQNAVVDTVFTFPGGNNLATDIVSYATSGDITVNGNPAPPSALQKGELEMRDTSENGLEDIVYLGETSAQSYNRRIITRRYAVHYMHLAGNAGVPRNADARLVAHSNVWVNGSPIDIEIPSTTYNGDFTINGIPTPPTALSHGNVVLIDKVTGAETLIEDTAEQEYTLTAIDGEYDLAYRVLQSGGDVPENEFMVFATDVAFPFGGILLPQQVDIDIPMTAATIELQQNDASWNPADGSAIVSLNAAEGTDAGQFSIELGNTDDAPWETNLVSGDYTVSYSHNAGSNVPRNVSAHFPGVRSVQGSTDTLVLNFYSMDFSPSALINSLPFPGGQSTNLTMFLANGSLSFGAGGGTWAAMRAFLGRYQAHYSHINGNDIPANDAHQKPCIDLTHCLHCDGFEGT